ncbi:MAG TPA: DUF3300 domain-containing protein [Thermoanaerobaculia bacterium]|nr:DUF3300 domain-containing protein [Thermoanaerobaculia bacterium]
MTGFFVRRPGSFVRKSTALALAVLGWTAAVPGPVLMALQAAPAAAPAENPGEKAAAGFTAAQLEQMVAPIALYPDSLLTQILMASTYPLEIVEASRWSQKNSALKGTQLEEALKKQDWDVSVKSLCGFPDVLKRLNENLDWTQDLGDAFLSQKSEVMDAVQRMRNKAYDAGNLKTTEQQKVEKQPDKIIVIQSASPEVVYVPTYSCTVVYGPYWTYPYYYYPAYYYAPPGYGAMMFTAGVVWGAAMWGGCHWGWGHTTVNVNVNRYNSFNKTTNINYNRTNISNTSVKTSNWNHSPEHRKGVNYNNSKTAQQYGAKGGSARATQNQARGYSGASTAPARSQASFSRASTASRPAASSSSGTRSSGGGSSTWSGAGSSGLERSASSRGASSRGTSTPSSGGGRKGR